MSEVRPTKATIEITKDEWTKVLYDQDGKVIARELMVRVGRGRFKGDKKHRIELPEDVDYEDIAFEFDSLCGMDIAQAMMAFDEELEEEEDEDDVT